MPGNNRSSSLGWFERLGLLLVCLISLEGLASGQVKGTATYRERMAMPANAVFEATLEDVSKADAKAEVIGQARVEQPGNPPIRFEIIGVWPGETCGARFAAEPLENTYWKLTRLGDTSVTVASQQREPHFILNAQTRQVGGSGGCNRLMGGYELKGDALTFGQMAATRMACPQGMDTEKAFLDALGQVKKWKIAGQHLELFDDAGKLVARFEARHMK